ncbi:hypothetical protein CC117_00765 [Parafrankia colletiae]|uniref:Uncharacterized protein n=1 Tax=Parafrankia colletiae TaxID=573497 RepID=A0A1S1RKB2_9ACTN|nr:hypothetical protein [Parafrankia colletiae]MCK9904272.1 hypothetical protein [Frankia sp. Cpl3]OHV46221.1 hypothetical protein CC117_00765 [Parafrankia colletiae]
MTLPVLTAAPDPGDGPDSYLPVLRDLSLDGYLAFTGALDQARHLVTMHRRDADNPALPAVTRAQAAAVATTVQATLQLFAALIDDRTDLDTPHAEGLGVAA